MSKGLELRALVAQRLAAAAEEIFQLFERSLAEFEEELRGNHRRLKSPAGPQPSAGAGVHSPPGMIYSPPGKNQSLTGLKEEPEEQLPVSVPEFVCVKREESSLIQGRQTEHREETQGEEPHSHSEAEGHGERSSDTDNDWEPFSGPAANGGHDDRDRSTAALNSDLSPEYESAAEPGASVSDGGTYQGAERKQECPFCLRRFTCNANLQVHLRNHTGERPYSCSVCEKTFAHKNILVNHRRRHTGEKPYSCSRCGKTFAHNSTLSAHMRVHTGEKPFSCTLCDKTFAQRSTLDKHLRIHRGEKPYSCSVCQKPFAQKSDLNAHARTHTGEKPYSCSVCQKEFAVKSNLYRHMGTHGEGLKSS